MVLKAGDLDRSIVIQQITESRTTTGAVTETPSTFATVWAQVLPITTAERFSSDAKHGVYVNRFRIRKLTGLTEKMQISFESKIWKIIAISNIGRNEGHDIIAESVQ